MKPLSKSAPQPPQQSQDIVEILRQLMSRVDLLTKRVEKIEESRREPPTNDAEFKLDDSEATTRTAISIALNHGTPRRGGRVQSPMFSSESTRGIPAHVGHPAASASPSSSYHHLLAPSTPQRQHASQSPRSPYQAKEEPLPSASQIIFTQDVPTPEEAASRLAIDQSNSIGPPFFVIFSGQLPGVFTSWPFVMRTCKWLNGDWKRYETRSAALQAYKEAYILGGLRIKE